MAPSTHENVTAPEISGVLDLDGTEMGETASTAPQIIGRGYRATGDGDPYAATTTHHSTGNPDPRRGHATILTDPGHETQPEAPDNSLALLPIDPESPPDRPRQGFTGADPARPATTRRPLFLRLFDKAISEHPGPVLKVEQTGPLASRPRSGLEDVAHGQPFAGGSTGTQAAGIGPGRNSFRILPNQWDTLLVDTGGPAVSAANPDPAYTAASGQVSRGRFRA